MHNRTSQRKKTLSAFLLGALGLLAQCAQPAPVLLVKLTGVPENAIQITVNVGQAVAMGKMGSVVFYRETTTNKYLADIGVGRPPTAGSPAAVDLAVDLPSEAAGAANVRVVVEGGMAGAAMDMTPGGQPGLSVLSETCGMTVIEAGKLNSLPIDLKMAPPCPTGPK